MSQARKKMLEQIKNKEESEVKRKKTTKEKYKELRESIKGPEPTPQSFSDKRHTGILRTDVTWKRKIPYYPGFRYNPNFTPTFLLFSYNF